VGQDHQTSARVLRELHRDALSRGLFAGAGAAYIARLCVCLPLVAALAFVAWMTASGVVMLLASALAGFVSVQIGFVAHDAGHGAVSRRAWINELAGQLAFSVVNGLGFQSWKLSHDAHHAHSQDESGDPDMQVDTAMSLTLGSARSKTGLGRWLLPFQGYYLWPLSTLFAHSLRIQSLGCSYRGPRHFAIDAAVLPVHYALWLVLPLLWLDAGAARVACVYLISSAVVGAYLALLFWVNHVGMPALQADHGRSVLEQQVVGSRNVRNPAALDWFFGGLNFQIEHHLLPGCPSMRLRRAQPLTRAACHAHALPYHEERFGEALASVTRHVFVVARDTHS
jgi:fatty acid desaturase